MRFFEPCFKALELVSIVLKAAGRNRWDANARIFIEEKYMKRVLKLALAVVAVMALSVAHAAAAKTFVILPFEIKGPEGYNYLKNSIPQMLSSRLYARGEVEPSVADLPASQSPAADQGEAEKARQKYKADYVIWGSLTVIGDDCSLDVRVKGKDSKTWRQGAEPRTTQLLGSIKGISDSINKEIFGRTTNLAGSGGKESVNQMNPAITRNPNANQEVYLNPDFRYSGSTNVDESRMRTQALPFTALGMEVVDADGDGRNEVFLLEDSALHAYRFNGDQLDPIAKYDLPKTSTILNIRSLPSRSGRASLILNIVDSSNMPQSRILTFNGSAFQEEMKNIKFLLNVAKLPPDFQPVLIGQRLQQPKLFHGGVYEMVKMGGEFSTGKRIDLPSGGNVLNFAFIPAGKENANAEKVAVLTESEKLSIYTNTTNPSRLWISEESFSGSARGLEIDSTMPGMSKDTVTLNSFYYMPMRMLAVDLERDGNFELILNKPISTASTIFDRYRFFPQAEIHSLFWDGLGMNIQWKTRRIKGSMADYAIVDANNDGILDLVCCINTHPGALGVQSRKCIVIVYPLDLDSTASSTKVHPSFVEEE